MIYHDSSLIILAHVGSSRVMSHHPIPSCGSHRYLGPIISSQLGRGESCIPIGMAVSCRPICETRRERESLVPRFLRGLADRTGFSASNSCPRCKAEALLVEVRAERSRAKSAGSGILSSDTSTLQRGQHSVAHPCLYENLVCSPIWNA